MIAIEVRTGDKGDRVLEERVPICIQRTGYNVDTLHPRAGSKSDCALNRDRVGRGDLLAGEVGEVLCGDGVDAVEGGDVVVAELRRVRNARAAG